MSERDGVEQKKMTPKRIITLFAFIICLLFAAYYSFGFVLRNNVEFLVSEFFPKENFTYEFISYQQGIFNSKAVLKLGTNQENEFAFHQVLDFLSTYPEQLAVQVVLDIHHGPVPIAALVSGRSSLFEFGVINVRLDTGKMTGKRISDLIPFEVDPLVTASIHLDGSGIITITLTSNSVAEQVKGVKLEGEWSKIEANLNFNSDVTEIDFGSKIDSFQFGLNSEIFIKADNSAIKVDFDNSQKAEIKFAGLIDAN